MYFLSTKSRNIAIEFAADEEMPEPSEMGMRTPSLKSMSEGSGFDTSFDLNDSQPKMNEKSKVGKEEVSSSQHNTRGFFIYYLW